MLTLLTALCMFFVRSVHVHFRQFDATTTTVIGLTSTRAKEESKGFLIMVDNTVKIDMSDDVANHSSPTFIDMDTQDMDSQGVVNEPAVVQESIDTTDKKSQNAKLMNTFAAKKTVAQGMMDIALITANANQLRYLIEYQRNSSTYYLIMILIIISLVLQVAVGLSLIFKGRFDVKGKSNSINAQKINNCVVVMVFLITIINVFIAAFSINVSTAPLSQTQ